MFDSTVSIFEISNSIATWFAAIGTVSTAVLALRLSVRDRQVRIIAIFSPGIIPGDNPRVLNRHVFILSFVNNGPRAVTIINHFWKLPFKSGSMVLFPNIDTPVANVCTILPAELTDGKSGNIFYQLEHFLNLDNPEKMFFHHNRKIAWLRIYYFRLYLTTSIGKRVKVKVSRSARDVIWKQYTEL